jgi:hypothetical protein
MKNLFILPLILGLFILSCTTANNPTYQLTTTVSPTEGGTISPSSGTYSEGEVVSLTATPSTGWRFVRWEGDWSGAVNPVNIGMNRNYNVVGIFEKRNYPLTINIEGYGEVEERVIQQKTTEYPYQTVVELTPVPDTGWRFVEWSGDLTGSEFPKQIAIDSEKTVTAKFERKNYPLTINVVGEGTVKETVLPQRTTQYPFEAAVILEAIPSDGWEFAGWSGDLSGEENPKLIVVDGDKSVIATFRLKSYSVNLNIFGLGTVQITPQQSEFTIGTPITLTPVADDDWRFVEWGGDLSGSEVSKQIIVDSTKNISAYFTKNIYTYGGSSNDIGIKAIESVDGGYALMGRYFSNDGDFSAGNKGYDDIFLLKLSNTGVVEWNKTIGGGNNDYGNDLIQTSDGGYLITGGTASNDGDFNGLNQGIVNIVLTKISPNGELQWIKTFGGSSVENGNNIKNTVDGGYVITGYSRSNDGDFAGKNKGQDDIFVLKLTSTGNIQWIQTYGGSEKDISNSISQTMDGGYILTGFTRSNDGDFNDMKKGERDVFVLKLDSNGNLQWIKTYGGSGSSSGSSIVESMDGGYVLTGYTNARYGDFGGPILSTSILVLKLNNVGSIEWYKIIGNGGGGDGDRGYSILQSNIGNYVIVGAFTSNTGIFNRLNRGNNDMFVVSLESNGEVEWLRTFGGSGYDLAQSVSKTIDGNYMITGLFYSDDGDFDGIQKGNGDIFLLKMNSAGILVEME